ncbi:MAG: DUF2232 domain-containing protein, partial [Arcobacteraceae bacterium]|nr:DUF2232 domain-containing protein [Arcobacteraceae bacterium]
MFNKEGIPFFIIVIPFLSVILVSFLCISYYIKLSTNNLDLNIKEYKELYLQNHENDSKLEQIIKNKVEQSEKSAKEFSNFVLTLTFVVIIFMILFSYIMILLVNDVVKKYKIEVQDTENELKVLNDNLQKKVQYAIEEAKQKDRKILEQGKLARIGSMISMIAHQW